MYKLSGKDTSANGLNNIRNEVTHMTKPTVPTPPIMNDGVVRPIFIGPMFAAKIEYLLQLRQIEDGPLSEQTIRSRIDKVCDSIEKDLGL